MKETAPNLGDAVSRLPTLARFRFELQALDPIALPEYPGSAWRGLLGHGLRRTACVTGQPTCAGCLLIHACVYSALFETPPPPGKDIVGFTAMPHPFVLQLDPEAPQRYPAGTRIDVGLTLVGPSVAQLPYLIRSLDSAGQQGVGRDRGRFRVGAVAQETALGSDRWERVYQAAHATYRPLAPLSPSLPPAPERVALRLRTPLRIKRDGRFVVPERFTLTDFFRHLYNRIQRLALLYGGQPEGFEWHESAALVGGLQLCAANLSWHDWTRYSARQSTLMQLGGLMGDLIIAGPAIAHFWPVLWVGQWTHVGKGTSFGLGAYRLEEA
jgi:DNA-binding transcriptional regulator of glucitol operon